MWDPNPLPFRLLTSKPFDHCQGKVTTASIITGMPPNSEELAIALPIELPFQRTLQARKMIHIQQPKNDNGSG